MFHLHITCFHLHSDIYMYGTIVSISKTKKLKITVTSWCRIHKLDLEFLFLEELKSDNPFRSFSFKVGKDLKFLRGCVYSICVKAKPISNWMDGGLQIWWSVVSSLFTWYMNLCSETAWEGLFILNNSSLIRLDQSHRQTNTTYLYYFLS